MDRATTAPNRTAIVFAGGERVDVAPLPPLPSDALLIAADGGLAEAERLGLQVDVIVGDLDSVDPVALEAAVTAGAAIERHSRNKDATDLELAFDHATRSGCRRIIVVGGLGGRIDHLLANALLLGTAPVDRIVIEWWAGAARVSVVRSHRSLQAAADEGDIVSLIPIGGSATGIRTTGLRWQLAGDTLEPGSTRGISNEAANSRFSISVEGGVLLVVHHREPKES